MAFTFWTDPGKGIATEIHFTDKISQISDIHGLCIRTVTAQLENTFHLESLHEVFGVSRKKNQTKQVCRSHKSVTPFCFVQIGGV